MAHWAELDENNVVSRVVVTDNDEPDEGYQWLIDNFGGTWVQTSYNGNIRYNFASVGGTYDEQADAFVPVQEYESWVLNTETYTWEPPVQKPEGASHWEEETQSWFIPVEYDAE